MEDKKLNQEFDGGAAELQSESWKTVGQSMKTEVQHFTYSPETQHFAVVKVSKNDNVYGIRWGNLVRKYLQTAYSGDNTQAEVISDGVTYKVLKREGVTSFYDENGNTLFDVENERLVKEYGYLMDDSNQDKVQTDELKEDTGNAGSEGSTDLEKEKTNSEVDEASEEEKQENTGEISGNAQDDVTMMKTEALEQEDGEPTKPETEVAEVENAKPAKQRAKEKLEKEMQDANDKTFAEPVITYLLKRCEEDEGIAQDVIQEHKTWAKCFDYIYAQAKKQSKGQCAAVRDDTVYEWAEDYYHRDDKAEEEKKAKAEAERKKKAAAAKKATPKAEKKAETSKPARAPKAEPKQEKPKKNSKDMDGQMDIFSMMGM
ncbi:MAG: PcfK-like family protein [Clostridiaceae bacterium]|nr:PcfK-like family protein [Clostridiaceae bacterium]